MIYAQLANNLIQPTFHDFPISNFDMLFIFVLIASIVHRMNNERCVSQNIKCMKSNEICKIRLERLGTR